MRYGEPSTRIDRPAPCACWQVRADPDGSAAHAYRTWVRVVLMPLSETAARTAMERADLLEGSGISPLLLQLVAHVSAYKVISPRCSYSW